MREKHSWQRERQVQVPRGMKCLGSLRKSKGPTVIEEEIKAGTSIG